MSHCDHCHSKIHRKFFSAKRVGVFGAVLVVLHLLFHLVELLLLPAVLIGVGSHAAEEAATAIDEAHLQQEFPLSQPSRTALPNILWPADLELHPAERLLIR